MIHPYNLYNGEIELVFDEAKHVYFVKNDKVPSVTKILGILNKPALIGWSSNQAVDHVMTMIKPGVSYDEIQLKNCFDQARKAYATRRDAAGDVGTFVHQWVNDYISGKKPPLPVNPDIRAAVEKFMEWEAKHDVKFLLTEEPIYSKKHHFAGTLDWVAKIDGKLVLGDLKTSSGIWPEMYLQVAAYQLARQEEYPEEKYDYRGIIRIGRTGEFEWKLSEADQYQDHVDAFLACRTIHRIMEEKKNK